jgi:hypothetical protein|tara:strand:- start:409 stop:576 length:168 start_codon:yes stop_codon:yes gene_type:complete
MTEYTIGQIIRYEQEIKFKGIKVIEARILAIRGVMILLDNGDELNMIQLEIGKAY